MHNAFTRYESLQLNTYKTIIEEKYGKKVVGLCLVCLHPNNSDYQLIEVPFMEKEMTDLFQYRREMLVKQAQDKSQDKAKNPASAKSKTTPAKTTHTIDNYFTRSKPNESKPNESKLNESKLNESKPNYAKKGLILNLNDI